MAEDKRHLHVALSAGTALYLEAVAEEFGFIAAKGGHRHGKPSITQLLEAIGSGELVVKTAQGELPGIAVSRADVEVDDSPLEG